MKLTTDHSEIRDWADRRGGRPAGVLDENSNEKGIILFEFPDNSPDQELKRKQWRSFFSYMDSQQLALLYKEQTEAGRLSEYYKLIHSPVGIVKSLYDEHEQILDTFEKLADTSENAQKTRAELIEKLENLLKPHMYGEEKVFYKELKKRCRERDEKISVLEGREEHESAKMMLKRFLKTGPDKAKWSARLKVLKELVSHHIEEEQTELFDLAFDVFEEEALADLDDMYNRKKQKR
jgi:hemerythrin-like domain-containing protein